jgi:FAD:protein FMN transferase
MRCRCEARFLLLILCGLALCGCQRPPAELVLSGPTMGTTYTVRVVAAPEGLDAYVLRHAAEQVLAGIDQTMSGYREDSEIARFNAWRGTDWYPVSRELAQVVHSALEVSALSAGAFDVTVAPVVNAWGFGTAPEPRVLPDAQLLAQLSAHVGYRKLHVRTEPPALRKDTPALSVDLNGIAPGYAVDCLAQRLQALRVERFLIDIGGEIRVRGLNARNNAWRIAVERPLDAPPAPHVFIELDTAAVTTSGEYRHYFIREGRRYSHTIDPRTARPIEHELGSVVVIGNQAALADAWATALNVLGAREGYEMAARHGLAAMFIEGGGGGWHARSTPQFKQYLAAP